MDRAITIHISDIKQAIDLVFQQILYLITIVIPFSVLLLESYNKVDIVRFLATMQGKIMMGGGIIFLEILRAVRMLEIVIPFLEVILDREMWACTIPILVTKRAIG